MKKALSILMAVMVLIAGIHLSVASHFCQNELISVNISVSKAFSQCCDTGKSTPESPSGKIFKKVCCSNSLATLSVDSNYAPSFFKNTDVALKTIHTNGFLLTELARGLALCNNPHPVLSPPLIFPINKVELSEICVFRI